MVTGLLTLAQNSSSEGMMMLVIQLAIVFLMIAGLWKVFAKAGQPGWAAIVPIYNLFILCKIAGKPAWWVLLCLVPFVNIIVFAVLCISVAKAFGKGMGFGLGMWLLGMIFYPILGFGSAQYQGPQAA